MRILVVEDHKDTREVLTSLLARRGHEVLGAADVNGALCLLATVAFDILLSDIGLPDGDGFAVVAEARHRQHLKMTVALSAYASAEDRERGLSAGFDHYLTKPLDIQRLNGLIAMAA